MRLSVMETAPERRNATLSELVAEEVRAQMGRKRMSQAQLARGVGKTEMWVSLRLRGKQAIDLNDLMAIATVLGIDASELVTPDVVAKAKDTEGGSNRDFDLAPAGATATVGHSSVDLAKGVTPRPAPRPSPPPSGPSRPLPNRPVSAVPARKRRPRLLRPANRAGAK